MRAIWIDDQGISELDIETDWQRHSSIRWEAFELTDTHVGWTDEVGLLRPDPLIATFSNGQRIALPVLILGRDRDMTVAATMTNAELGAMVILEQNPVAWRQARSGLGR